jgi:hypothetical protein
VGLGLGARDPGENFVDRVLTFGAAVHGGVVASAGHVDAWSQTQSSIISPAACRAGELARSGEPIIPTGK